MGFDYFHPGMGAPLTTKALKRGIWRDATEESRLVPRGTFSWIIHLKNV